MVWKFMKLDLVEKSFVDELRMIELSLDCEIFDVLSLSLLFVFEVSLFATLSLTKFDGICEVGIDCESMYGFNKYV